MQDDQSSFEWDEKSQLYFHSSSGFYHDPNAGWYYSSKDGLYYKFENGNYVLWESEQGEGNESQQDRPMDSDALSKDETGSYLEDANNATAENPCNYLKNANNDDPENLRPPSEWLEETLVNLYLAGYALSNTNVVDGREIATETYACESSIHQGDAIDDADEIEEGEIISDGGDLQDAAESSGRVFDEGAAWEEENWRAQYGQVTQSEEDVKPSISSVDLWEWTMVTEIIKKKKHGRKKKYRMARLVGKLVKPSTKLHPSMPVGGSLIKTAAVREVYLDLVRVSSGQVYQLRTPSVKYLTSLSTFDSSDPTKDWGFPKLQADGQNILSPNLNESIVRETANEIPISKHLSALLDQTKVSEKLEGHLYQDRAVERRALHGGFGVGPGQKNVEIEDDIEILSRPDSFGTEEAAVEALNMSFGTGSYARRLLENMGWKEGETLGNTMKGLTEPLQAVGNKGSAGLGWIQNRPNYSRND
ncbi:hypothetical protein MKX03_003164 [Papaver bracteatum]|nr:hypothetical protein MKX03_003164 [Papaver bracteatum]